MFANACVADRLELCCLTGMAILDYPETLQCSELLDLMNALIL